uniref:Uncharacterized protein n=1 Tax=Arundo donax TaxID=35708 RepID=A0A0A8YUJ1_ARUDO
MTPNVNPSTLGRATYLSLMRRP